MGVEATTDQFKALRGTVDSLVSDMAKHNEEERRIRHDSEERQAIERKDRDKFDRIDREASLRLRRRLRNVGIWVAGVAGIAAAALGAWQSTQPPKPETVEAADVKVSVEKSAENIKGRLEELEGTVEGIETVTVDQQIEIEATQVQQAAGFEFIGQKIDRAHPRQADDVPVPEILTDAKERYRDEAVRRRLFGKGD